MKQVQPTSRAHIDRIDALRGIAALMVAIYHALGVISIPGLEEAIWDRDLPQGDTLSESIARLLMVLSNGSAAVSLFFVMSGLVLGLSIDKWQGNSLRNSVSFIIQRLFRIGPALWATALSIGLMLTVYRAQHEPLATDWFNRFYNLPVTLGLLVKNLTLTTAGSSADGWLNPVTWSLQVEMGVSLLFPLLYMMNRCVSMRWHLPVLAILLAIPAVLKPGPISFLNFLFMFYLGLMLPAWGAKLAFVVRSSKVYALAVFLTAVIIMLVAKGIAPRPGVMMVMEAGGAFMLLAAVLHGKDNTVFRLLDAPIIRFYGRISYSFYLIDFPVLYIISVMTMHLLPSEALMAHALLVNVMLAAAGIVISTGLAAVCYQWVELPGIKLGRRLTGWAGRQLMTPKAAGRALASPLEGDR
ncbi:acyltransferase family protein [Noviherbaspirillum autotrophicum]|nr:acyltransferase [Noviherbaspirillum autotrophicum]